MSPYTRLSRVSPALHTLRQGKGLLTSLCHVFYRHIHGACCAGADNSSQSFISRCWHAASSVPRLDMICPSASFGLRDISPRPLRQYPAWNAGLRGSQGGACNSVLCWHKAYKSAPDCLFYPNNPSSAGKTMAPPLPHAASGACPAQHRPDG